MMQALLWFAALGSALLGGVFFAFSSFVMAALGRLPPERAIAAMQAINAAVLTPAFLGPFLGTTAASTLLVAAGCVRADRGAAKLLIAGGTAFVLGCFLVTVLGNVPLNRQLADLAPDAAGAGGRWDAYARPWLRLNHLRAGGALLASALFILALARRHGGTDGSGP